MIGPFQLLRAFGPLTGGSSPPSTPTLSQPVDNGNGTGAAASITGSSAGSTNQVYTAPWAASGTNLTWTLAATRTGDGAVALPLSSGVYVAKCQSTLAGLPAIVSNEPLFQVTGGATPSTQHWALIQAVAAKLQSVALTRLSGIAADSIRARKIAVFNDYSAAATLAANFHALPGIIVCFWSQEKLVGATNLEDDWDWPVMVALATATDTSQLEADNDQHDNRRTVAELFVHQAFSTVTPTVNYWNCEVEFGPILDPGLLQQKGVMVGAVGLRFKQRTTRG